jgi:hypothetical protein
MKSSHSFDSFSHSLITDSTDPENEHHLFDRHRLGQVTREINVQTLSNCQPVGHQLERDDVQKTLQTINCPWNLDLFGLSSLEFFVIWVADDDRSTRTGNDY